MLIATRSRRLAFLLALALSCSLTARADEASHRAKANEVMVILHTQPMVHNISETLKKKIADAADQIAGPAPTESGKAKVVDFEKKANQIIDAQLGWETMQARFTDIFAKNFTEEQLDSIIAFYKSPAGVALLETMPTVNDQMTQFGNSQITALQPQLKQLFEDFQKSVAAAAPAAPASAPAEKPAPANPPAVVHRPAPSATPAPSSTPK
jgi:hypothetical protein